MGSRDWRMEEWPSQAQEGGRATSQEIRYAQGSEVLMGRHNVAYHIVYKDRMDWLYLLATQGTLKSLLQHHSSEASLLQCSAFFTVQLSHPYMTTGKTTWTGLYSVGEV